MKVAILSDIHGNSISLDAVLADVEARGGVDGYWFVGDYCALGFDPVGVLQRIQSLPNFDWLLPRQKYFEYFQDVTSGS